jgi:hypothetical protein
MNSHYRPHPGDHLAQPVWRPRPPLSHSAFNVPSAFGQVSTMPSNSSFMSSSTVSVVPCGVAVKVSFS